MGLCEVGVLTRGKETMRNTLLITGVCLLIVLANSMACRVSHPVTYSTSTSSPSPANKISTPARTPTPMKVELLQAISKGLVELKASVWDLETIETSMKSKSEAPLEITVDEGTI